MSHAVKAVTTERGLDAGSFTMVVYGGAGPLHASAIAREIGIRRVLIPFAPGYFSAYGMLFAICATTTCAPCFRKLERRLVRGDRGPLHDDGRRGPRGDRAVGVKAEAS